MYKSAYFQLNDFIANYLKFLFFFGSCVHEVCCIYEFLGLGLKRMKSCWSKLWTYDIFCRSFFSYFSECESCSFHFYERKDRKCLQNLCRGSFWSKFGLISLLEDLRTNLDQFGTNFCFNWLTLIVLSGCQIIIKFRWK